MDRISNNFMNSLRSDKTPSKSGQKSKNNTPSPYPQRNHLTNSGNNTKRRTLTQIGTQSQKVGNKTSRYSINQLNKSVSPQNSQAHSFGVDKVIQQKQSTVGNDYMKIFNMENIVNAQPIQNKNLNQNQKQDQSLFEPNFNKNTDVLPNQYFSSINFSKNAEQEQEKGFQSQIQQKQRTSLSYANNLFAQQKRDDQNPFFKQDSPFCSSNASLIQQKSTTCLQDGSQFFKNKYQQEKLFQGAEKNNNQSSNQMIVEFEANRNQNNNFFAANQKQQNSESMIQANQNIMLEEKSQNEQSNTMANIFSIKPMGQSQLQNQSTGLVLQEKSVNPQPHLDSRSQISLITQHKDPLISQAQIKQPSNLRDLRQRHKQMKSESGEKSFSLQSNILDKIKDFNDKMKNQSRKTQDEFKSENSNKWQVQDEKKSNQNTITDENESNISAVTINDDNKTLDDSLIQKLVSDQSQGFIQTSQSSNNYSQSEPLNILKESRIKYLTTKLDMIQESNTSKRSFVSGAFFQSQAEQKDKENIFGQEMNQNSQNYQKNFNIFGSQTNEIQQTRKNLFGKYDYKEESEDFDHYDYQNEYLSQNKKSELLFDSSDEQHSDNKINQKRKLSQSNQSNKKTQSEQDISQEGRQNMTNSILDKAFIGDITAVYSEKKSNQQIQQGKEALSQIIKQNQILNTIENEIFNSNQDSIGFSQKDQQIKRLDQMGCSDISPIQSQLQVKSSNSGSKKDNDQLIDELGQVQRNSLSLVNEFEILQIQNLNSQSLDKQGQNSTIPDKNQILMQSQCYENSCLPNSQNQSNKIDNSNSQSNENILKDEIQTPFIQQKLKNFLEDIGYYNDENKKHQINEIMSKITLGLVIDKANASKQKHLLEDKTLSQPESKTPYQQEQNNNRISIGQNSEYLSCQSRFSYQTIQDIPQNSSPQQKNNKMIVDDQSVAQNSVQIKEDLKNKQINDNSNKPVQDQEQIENKHFEQLKKEVEYLYQSCKGKDEAEKNITNKIFNDVLYPKLGYKTVLEAFKEAINRAREMKIFTKQNKKEFNDLYTEINQGQDISENENENSQSLQNKDKEEQNNNMQNQQSNKVSSRGLRRKMPTRGNKKKKENQSQFEISNTSSECISESENELSNSIDSDIDNAKNKGKSKANKLNKNKKLKKI
ncbi:hypothetical protein ABPG74_015174 [Tetrahymena malaccensis]